MSDQPATKHYLFYNCAMFSVVMLIVIIILLVVGVRVIEDKLDALGQQIQQLKK